MGIAKLRAMRQTIRQVPTFPLDHYGSVGYSVDMARTARLTKNTDSKGRITLGESFANTTMLVERRGDEIVLRLARVIPEREAWLYENEKALASVREGLGQARRGRFAKPGPDLAKAARIAAKIKGE